MPLDETGPHEKAGELAQRPAAHGSSVLWGGVFPSRRARETADVVAERIGLTPREDPRLMETDAGAVDRPPVRRNPGRTPEEFTRFAGGDPHFGFPAGETFTQQGVRVAGACHDIRRAEVPALVVCHGGVIRFALFSAPKPGAARRPRTQRADHPARPARIEAPAS